MPDSSSETKKAVETDNNVVNFIVSVVHNKIFPTIILLSFCAIFYPFVLIGPGGFFIKFLFVVISIPALIMFAVYLYGLSDLAPNLYEAYKRFKREFSQKIS